MSKEFWIAMGVVATCVMIAFFTKMLIISDIRRELRPVSTYSIQPNLKREDHNLSIEKRILILETKMALLLEERAEQAKK